MSLVNNNAGTHTHTNKSTKFAAAGGSSLPGICRHTGCSTGLLQVLYQEFVCLFVTHLSLWPMTILVNFHLTTGVAIPLVYYYN